MAVRNILAANFCLQESQFTLILSLLMTRQISQQSNEYEIDTFSISEKHSSCK